MPHASSPWRSPDAWRTYAAAVCWIAGSTLALATGEPDVAGWFRLRLDAAGVLLTIGALVGGWNFLPKGLRAARTLRLDMNFLMTVAIGGALLIGEPIEAAAIAVLFSLAELLEASAVTRARRSIEELLRLSPDRATVVRGDGSESVVDASALRTGDRVRVRPGERTPIDGVVAAGESEVDESTVTGESVPVPKRLGDSVFAGTIPLGGFLEVTATTDAGDSTLDRIVRLVRQAQSQRAPIEKFVDRFARRYTPAVTALAAATMLVPPLLGWGSGLEWFTRGLTLLVVACPCALVIATPVTVVSALTTAARHGVLIKSGEHLEALGGACAMAFDKTGSLTHGRLQVTDIVPVDEADAKEVLALAAAVEARSEHPIGRAIAALAKDVALPDVTEFQARPGRGVVGRVGGREVKVGAPLLFPYVELPTAMVSLEGQGKTVVLVGIDGRIVALVALADTLRPEAPAVLKELARLGVHEQVMLTGDREVVARPHADRLAITDVRASLLPEGKVEAVRALASRHRGVAMLGDGVNDAPALAAATVGIAMGAAGSPAAIESADVALMADDLVMLPYALRVARLARRLVRLNIALALGLKLFLAVGAVTGTVTLMVAVLVGDVGASVAVTLNAMRLGKLQSADCRL